MHQHNGWRIPANGFAEEFGNAHDRRMDGPLIRGHDAVDAIFRVEQHHAHLLLLQKRHFGHAELRDIRWRIDARAFAGQFDGKSFAQLERSLQTRGALLPNAVESLQFGKIRAGNEEGVPIQRAIFA